jgi:hypothetical protein
LSDAREAEAEAEATGAEEAMVEAARAEAEVVAARVLLGPAAAITSLARIPRFQTRKHSGLERVSELARTTMRRRTRMATSTEERSGVTRHMLEGNMEGSTE